VEGPARRVFRLSHMEQTPAPAAATASESGQSPQAAPTWRVLSQQLPPALTSRLQVISDHDQPWPFAHDPREVVEWGRLGHFSARGDLLGGQLVTVLDRETMTRLQGLSEATRRELLQRLLGPPHFGLILADDVDLPANRVEQPAPSLTVLRGHDWRREHTRLLDRWLAWLLHGGVTVHGDMLQILGCGVLLTGESAMGKSELALELLQRGQQLVADDAVQLLCNGAGQLVGLCPPPLHGLIEVRGLGVLDVPTLFGPGTVTDQVTLELNLHLLRADQLAQCPRWHVEQGERRWLDCAVPSYSLPVGAGRSLAALIETTVRHFQRTRAAISEHGNFIGRAAGAQLR